MNIRVSRFEFISGSLFQACGIVLSVGLLTTLTATLAQADIVNVLVNETLNGNQTVAYDLDDDGHNDVNLRITASGYAEFLSFDGVAETGPLEGIPPFAFAFGPGAIIDGGSFSAGTSVATLADQSTGNFYNPMSTVYVGFTFVSDFSTAPQTVNAWADVSVFEPLGGSVLQIRGFAFQSNGAPIVAGAIPEPSGLLILAAAGIATTFRRRRKIWA